MKEGEKMLVETDCGPYWITGDSLTKREERLAKIALDQQASGYVPETGWWHMSVMITLLLGIAGLLALYGYAASRVGSVNWGFLLIILGILSLSIAKVVDEHRMRKAAVFYKTRMTKLEDQPHE